MCWTVGSGSLTCDQISELGQSVTELDVAQLQTVSSSEFGDCAYQLGRVVNFTAEQWQALAGVAKQVLVYATISCLVVFSTGIQSDLANGRITAARQLA